MLQSSTIKFVRDKGLEPILGLGNAQRIMEIKGTDEEVVYTLGLEEGMKVVGFDPSVDATNHIDREFNAPSGREIDW